MRVRPQIMAVLRGAPYTAFIAQRRGAVADHQIKLLNECASRGLIDKRIDPDQSNAKTVALAITLTEKGVATRDWGRR